MKLQLKSPLLMSKRHIWVLGICWMMASPSLLAFSHTGMRPRSIHATRPITRRATTKYQISEQDETTARKRRTGMSIALTAAYFTVMAAKCALPSTLSMLTSPNNKIGLSFPVDVHAQQVFAKMLFTSTSAIAVGKTLLGPIIDKFGGTRSLQFALLSLSVLLATISVTQTIHVFAFCWVLVDFVFSSCWAACINAVHESFPENEWATHVGSLAAAARTGNAMAFAVFASMLSYFQTRLWQPWRPIFLLSSVLQLVPLVLLGVYGSSGTKQPTQTDVMKQSSVESSKGVNGPIQTLRREASTLEFWCHLISRSLLMVFASFLLFVPSLMSQIYGASPSAAAQVGSFYAIGCLLSVTAGSRKYAKLTRNNKIRLLVSLMSLATLSSVAQLGHMVGKWSLSLSASALSMFTWGFAFSIPFYLPPSLFALARGGTESSATIADVFDIGGFGLLAAFNGYVAGANHALKAAWVPIFQMTTTAAAISLVSLSVATWKEDKQK